MFTGNAILFGDNVSTDLIISGRYNYLRSNIPELAKHACEDIDPDFVQRVNPGDIIVAGRNFGMGSSREHAAIVLKENGISAIIARSVARIFYRNAINIGLPVIITETAEIQDGHRLSLDLRTGTLSNLTTRVEKTFNSLPPFMLEILNNDGLVSYVRKHGDLKV